jgi:hypothetical protein
MSFFITDGRYIMQHGVLDPSPSLEHGEKISFFPFADSIYDRNTYIYVFYTVITIFNTPTISNRPGFMFSKQIIFTRRN